jgi:hypothetical protein
MVKLKKSRGNRTFQKSKMSSTSNESNKCSLISKSIMSNKYSKASSRSKFNRLSFGSCSVNKSSQEFPKITVKKEPNQIKKPFFFFKKKKRKKRLKKMTSFEENIFTKNMEIELLLERSKAPSDKVNSIITKCFEKIPELNSLTDIQNDFAKVISLLESSCLKNSNSQDPEQVLDGKSINSDQMKASLANVFSYLSNKIQLNSSKIPSPQPKPVKTLKEPKKSYFFVSKTKRFPDKTKKYPKREYSPKYTLVTPATKSHKMHLVERNKKQPVQRSNI